MARIDWGADWLDYFAGNEWVEQLNLFTENCDSARGRTSTCESKESARVLHRKALKISPSSCSFSHLGWSGRMEMESGGGEQDRMAEAEAGRWVLYSRASMETTSTHS